MRRASVQLGASPTLYPSLLSITPVAFKTGSSDSTTNIFMGPPSHTRAPDAAQHLQELGWPAFNLCAQCIFRFLGARGNVLGVNECKRLVTTVTSEGPFARAEFAGTAERIERLRAYDERRARKKRSVPAGT